MRTHASERKSPMGCKRGLIQRSNVEPLWVRPRQTQLRDLKSLGGLQGLRTLLVNGRPANFTVLAYLKATGLSGGKTALGWSGKKPVAPAPEDTPIEFLPTEQLQDRKMWIAMTGLRQIHEVEAELDHVIPAVQTAHIDIQEDTQANFLGEIEVGVTPAKKHRKQP